MPAEDEFAALSRTQAGQRFRQLCLAVALHAGDPQDLARSHVKRDAAHDVQAAVVLDVQVLDLEDLLLWLRRALS